MAANNWNKPDDWGNEPTVTLPPFRTLPVGQCGDVLIHVTPTGHHLVGMDCDGVCLTCNQPLVGDAVQAN